MEGRAIARPNLRKGRHCDPPRRASMEGRAIARPNRLVLHRGRGVRPCFNGGPGNCPAKPPGVAFGDNPTMGFNGGPGNCPAKRPRQSACRPDSGPLQWRAGQLPGQTCERNRVRTSPYRFNGGPGNCPAKQRLRSWREGLRGGFNGGAGNCPAKRDPRNVSPMRSRCFNGGPGNCPAKLTCGRLV